MGRMEKTTKIAKVSLLTQALANHKSVDIDKIGFARILLMSCGCSLIAHEKDDSSDELIKKFLYTRGLTGILKNGFNGTINKKGATEFFRYNLKNEPSLFTDLGIKTARKNFNLLCDALVIQYENFIKFDDDAVFDYVRDLYNDVLADDKIKDELSHRKSVFEILPKFEKKQLETYLAKVEKNYSIVKTIIDPSAQINFYDIYVCNDLQLRGQKKLPSSSIENVSIKTLFEKWPSTLVIEASGGVGKTMMLTHLTLSAISNYKTNYLLPIFINLRDYSGEKDFLSYALSNINKYLEDAVSTDTLISLLESGMCLFLLDALDEIDSSMLYEFEVALKDFATKYDKNKFVASSRPLSKNSFLHNFAVVDLQLFSKFQAKQLIGKLEFRPDDPAIKSSFLNALDKTLYKSHEEFCSNPLLLTILLLTYEHSGIPRARHMFYEKAYESMAEKFDTQRGRFSRCFATGLTSDRLLEYIKSFCFISYCEDKYSFTEEQFETIFVKLKEKAKYSTDTFGYKEFLSDFENNLCLLYKEGKKYRFVHRSFQEYFCAAYLKDQKDKNFPSIAKFLDEHHHSYVHQEADGTTTYYVFDFWNDEVLSMLFEMAKERVEEFIYLPILRNNIISSEDEYLKFATFINAAFKDISWTSGDSEENGSNSFVSNVLEHIFRNQDYVDYFDRVYEDYLEDLELPRIVTEKDYYVSPDGDGHKYYNEAYRFNYDEMGEEIPFDGSYFKADTRDILEDIDGSKWFLDSLKETYIYDMYKVFVNLHKLLEEKYKNKDKKDIIDILD